MNQTRSEQINELATALAKVQGTLKPAQKDATNTFYKSNYAGLPQVWEACREVLSSNGLSVAQVMDTSENGMSMTTMLMHTSGQWISSLYPINPVKNDPQGLGSAITYARRYSLMAIVGVVADDPSDDDGNNSSELLDDDIVPLTRAERAAQHAIQIISSHGTRRTLENWFKGAGSSLDRVKAMDQAQYDRIITAYNIAIGDLSSKNGKGDLP